MKVTDSSIVFLLMILNVSAYENVFREHQFCAYKGQWMLITSIIYHLLTESEVITGKSQTEALMY